MNDTEKTIRTEEQMFIPPASKRGLGWPWDNTAPEFSLYQNAIANGKIGWLFNWEMWKPQGLPSGIEYVPEVRLGSQAVQIDQFLSSIHPGHFIGFNEPENAAESNIPVTTAVSLWSQFVEPAKSKFHFRLGSPAMTSAPAGKAWLSDFFRQLGGNASVDFVVVHWYGTDVHQLQFFLADMHSSFGKPLWLTEFAFSQFGVEPAPTASQVEAFMRAAIPFLDSCPYVERYAYFGAPTNVGDWVGEASNFSDHGLSITSVGKLYLEL